MEESLWELAPLFQLAGSPSLKTVSLTFSIQVSGLKCRCEQIFLLQRSQTAGRRVDTNLPAFLFLPRQHEREGGVQNQTRRHRRWGRSLANLEHPLPPPWTARFLVGLSGQQGPRGLSTPSSPGGCRGRTALWPRPQPRAAAWELRPMSSYSWVQGPQLPPPMAATPPPWCPA